MSGFRFRLVLPDGEPADPPAFVVGVPDWRVGDTFEPVKGRRFVILSIDPELDEEAWRETLATWVVQPVEPSER
jgi:hypothetical protein